MLKSDGGFLLTKTGNITRKVMTRCDEYGVYNLVMDLFGVLSVIYHLCIVSFVELRV